MNITFLGAAGTVTGSGFMLSDGPHRLLIDYGMFQGIRSITELNFAPLLFDPRKIGKILLTHAHLDHSGRLPILVKNGYAGEILMTAASRELTEIALLDAAKIAQESENGKILYDEKDVANVLSLIKIIKYGEKLSYGPYRFVFRDAGHILGSAFIEVENVTHGKRFVFSGDIGNYPEELVRPTEKANAADIVVIESTYGDRVHAKENPSDVLAEEINIVEETGGTLLVPAFSIERTQEILHRLDHLKRSERIDNHTKIFIDSPMAIAVTDVYKKFRYLYSRELVAHTSFDDPFTFPGLELVNSVSESKDIAKVKGPKVIIAGSGMMTGGRILHHAVHYLPMTSTRILFVGFQAEETVGRTILDGAQSVRIYDKEVRIHANVRKSSGLSAHADQPKLLDWLSAIEGVRKVFLVHGEDKARLAFASEIKSKLGIPAISMPKLGESAEIMSDQNNVMWIGKGSSQV